MPALFKHWRDGRTNPKRWDGGVITHTLVLPKSKPKRKQASRTPYAGARFAAIRMNSRAHNISGPLSGAPRRSQRANTITAPSPSPSSPPLLMQPTSRSVWSAPACRRFSFGQNSPALLHNKEMRDAAERIQIGDFSLLQSCHAPLLSRNQNRKAEASFAHS